MRFEARRRCNASSVQIGFVINIGVMTTFIAVMLVVLSGGFGEDLSTEEELEMVVDEVEANMIDADRIAQSDGEGGFTGYFEPPSSGVEYIAEIDDEGVMTVSAPDGSSVERDLDHVSITDVCPDETFEFTENDENIIIESGGGCMEMDIQRGATR